MFAPIRLKGLAGGTLLLSFAMLMVLLVNSAVVSYLNVQAMVRDFDSVQHSNQVLETVNQTTADLNAAESAARGYVNTGYEELAGTFRSEKSAVAKDLGELYKLCADNDKQEGRLRRIPPLLEERYKVLDEGIQRRRAGLPQIGGLTTVRQRLMLHDRLNSALEDFKGTENDLLNDRTAADNRSRSAADLSFLSMTGLAAFALVGFYVMVARAVRAEATRSSDLTNEVAARTSELVAANRDLESFSYSVSHDLRAPLRAVGSFARVLQEDAKGALSDENNETLDRIVEGCNRMSQLIDALLNLSRLSRTELVVTDVDLSDLATTVFREVTASEVGGKVVTQIEPGLMVRGDPTLLRLLITNLAANAVKFSQRSDPPIIKFGHESEGGEERFFVQDNGVGFDSERAKDLFEPFHRFHSTEEYPGTGVGLAICARIVRRHGGQIWAESRPGQGAKFYFTMGPLPGKRDHESGVSVAIAEDAHPVL